MNIDFTGHTAVVTATSRGIGLAVTQASAASAKVIGRRLSSAAELGKLGGALAPTW